ncbi:helix-turn-helix transcriptional regulator [Frankia sp. AvcI1]|uniref:helix-turn-helix domain-containing protein n=1 Tax=Frankia sp. AvcI1 TaxID=573496 RepID=UPI00211975AC|nr:helix-turn-helix transcriptional regulator [Frankia sp. AvcI1]
MKDLEEWLSRPDGLATRLRDLRRGTGMTGSAFADVCGWKPWKVSKIERGLHLPTGDDVEAWVAACGSEPAVLQPLLELREEGRRIRAGITDRRRAERNATIPCRDHLLAAATTVRCFESARVPELLRTAGYARAVVDEQIRLGRLDGGQVEQVVAAVMGRQQLLYAGGERSWEFLLAEPALYCQPAAGVMAGQLDRLHGMIGMPGVRFGVLPMGRRPPLVPVTGFQLIDDLAVVELLTGETRGHEPEARLYRDVMDEMWRHAVEGEEARRMIVLAREDLAGDSAAE